MALKDSQKIMYQHSEVKILLLKLYLERYLNILNQSPHVSDVFLYDLFCGEGIYPNGGKGSPIAILETIKEIHSSNLKKGMKTGAFHCQFNDINANKVRKLQGVITNMNLQDPKMVKLEFSATDYRKLIPEIKDKISSFQKEKAFLFIDPYGYKDIRINDIRNLLSSRKSEVLLFLPTRDMFRFEKKVTPTSLKEFISELVPEKDWPNSSTGLEFIDNLTLTFREKLDAYFVDSFVITRDTNQYFCLFFFTSHIYGFDRMLDAKWKIDEEEGRGWTYESEQNLFSQVEKKPNVLRFEKKIEDFLIGGVVSQ